MPARQASKELYVEEHGEGPPLLLIQGLGQTMCAWSEQVPVFSRKFRTITYDARGTGRTPRSRVPYGIPELAEDAKGVLAGRRADIVALSMGGYVALTLALAQPELVRSLVLVGTGAGGPDRVPRPAAVREAFTAAMGLPYEQFARLTMPYTFAPGWAEAHPQRFEELVAARNERPTPYEVIEEHVRACYGFYEAGCEVERIGVRALVVHGDEDLIVPVENGRVLASRLRNADYVELAGRGHNLPLEDPDTLNRIVLDFLA
jgi:pimeloyl-ACP methyl ester carboxylesterase